MGVLVLRTWACQRDIHSPISNVVFPRGTGPAVVKAERSAVNGNGCPTPVGGWVPPHSDSCRGLYRPSVGRGLRVYRVGGSVPCSVSNQPSSTLMVLGHKRVPRSVINSRKCTIFRKVHRCDCRLSADLPLVNLVYYIADLGSNTLVFVFSRI